MSNFIKSQVRQQAKLIRKDCSLSEADKQSFQQILLGLLENVDSPVIAGYAAIHSELDLSFLGLDLQIPQIVERQRLLGFDKEPDVFLVPLLVFDKEGHRLGYGGGYYDTTLAYYRQKKHIIAIGVAYEEQLWREDLPCEAHDQKLDYIVTPQRLRKFTT
jgi:5-formyltetrahydrofolate cyclo-ligase